jgi:hypothetical protein
MSSNASLLILTLLSGGGKEEREEQEEEIRFVASYCKPETTAPNSP